MIGTEQQSQLFVRDVQMAFIPVDISMEDIIYQEQALYRSNEYALGISALERLSYRILPSKFLYGYKEA